MTVDTEIKMRGLDALTNSLGLVDAERFVFFTPTGSVGLYQVAAKSFHRIERRGNQPPGKHVTCNL